MTAPIVLTDYDPTWPERYEQEKQRLLPVLDDWLYGGIEHIGSTAVAGLAAKPIIDMMAGVKSLDTSSAAIKALEPLDYRYWPYKPKEMHWFCKPTPEARTHHLHLVPFGSRVWLERLKFRDALRNDKASATEYAQLKRQLMATHGNDRETYTDRKTPFIRALVARLER